MSTGVYYQLNMHYFSLFDVDYKPINIVSLYLMKGKSSRRSPVPGNSPNRYRGVDDYMRILSVILAREILKSPKKKPESKK